MKNLILLIFIMSCTDIVEDSPYLFETVKVDSPSRYINSGQYGYLNINSWDVYIDDFIPFMESHYQNYFELTLKELPNDKVILFAFTSSTSAYIKTMINGQWKGVLILPAVTPQEIFFHEIGHHIHEFKRTLDSDHAIIQAATGNPWEWFANLYSNYRVEGIENEFLNDYLDLYDSN